MGDAVDVSLAETDIEGGENLSDLLVAPSLPDRDALARGFVGLAEPLVQPRLMSRSS
jgi:hypothetical protein